MVSRRNLVPYEKLVGSKHENLLLGKLANPASMVKRKEIDPICERGALACHAKHQRDKTAKVELSLAINCGLTTKIFLKRAS
jgi:hypothetical protein